MNAVDTNVLVYQMDQSEAVKSPKAVALLRMLAATPVETILLWQVAAEFLQQLRRWEATRGLSRTQWVKEFAAVRSSFRLVIPTSAVLDRSLDLADRYSLSHWDSMIVAACIEAGVTKLYTEDMGSPTKFDSLELENPFV
ncbi:MAG TPA: PIN domain-containing protein [Pirellulaceae bacterium]|nr:PIN domain-containing protein [Pirellulaceae bacterium]